MDDMPRGRLEKVCEYFLIFILPVCHYSYVQKFSIALHLLTGKKQLPAEAFTPMEEAKHSSVDDISRILYKQFDVVENLRQNAFVGTPVMRLNGRDTFRYPTARALVSLDRLLCQFGIVKGFDQIMSLFGPMLLWPALWGA